MTYNEYQTEHPGANKDDIIKKFTSYAHTITLSSKHMNYNNEDGMLGAALLGLCEAVESILKHPDVAMGGIVVVTIRRYIIDFVRKDRTIPVHHTAAKDPTKCPYRLDMDETANKIAPTTECQCRVEMYEIIEDLHLTYKETMILAGLLNQESHKEIAERLGIHITRISQLRKPIKKKMRCYLEKDIS